MEIVVDSQVGGGVGEVVDGLDGWVGTVVDGWSNQPYYYEKYVGSICSQSPCLWRGCNNLDLICDSVSMSLFYYPCHFFCHWIKCDLGS